MLKMKASSLHESRYRIVLVRRCTIERCYLPSLVIVLHRDVYR